MILVSYLYSFPYRPVDEKGSLFPCVPVRLKYGYKELDASAILDSGAEESLFDWRHATTLGLTINQGNRKDLSGLGGGKITAYLHTVSLMIGDHTFTYKIGFPDPVLHTQPLRCNLLGRNFFEHVKVGFREKYLEIYLDPTP